MGEGGWGGAGDDVSGRRFVTFQQPPPQPPSHVAPSFLPTPSTHPCIQPPGLQAPELPPRNRPLPTFSAPTSIDPSLSAGALSPSFIIPFTNSLPPPPPPPLRWPSSWVDVGAGEGWWCRAKDQTNTSG